MALFLTVLRAVAPILLGALAAVLAAQYPDVYAMVCHA